MKYALLAAIYARIFTLFFLAQTPAQTPTNQLGLVVTQTAVPQVDIFRTASLTYTLTQTPIASASILPMVFVNGVLMASPDDFTIAGTTVTFTGQSTDQMDTPIVQVLYWTAAQ